MKKYLKIFGWICLGILLQLKFDVLYEIVCLENLSFHSRLYSIKMNLAPTPESVRVLHIETAVRYSLGKDYFVSVYIPSQYKVINKSPQLGAEVIPGYQAYSVDMKRKYRDVLAATDFIIVPKIPDEEIPPAPIHIHFENSRQRLHADKTYTLSTISKDTQLKGPPTIEVKYPQQWGF
ncbi:MAG: hypothetical protein A3K09_01285 [Nitrospinae bacterium RIFCSPLOWO2_12_FULL_47_7]|nr:MAG: hypothetical protein A3K09_01285 [Nitrospinae bacterium RIFCSPLOWO2_12_FULL_47_7]